MAHGWNYVGLYVEEIYEYSYIRMYNKHTYMTAEYEGWDDINWITLNTNYAH